MNLAEQTAGQLLQLFLMSSYLYYGEDISVLTDPQFDEVCRRLLELWDTFEHQHKYLVSRDDLEAGSGFAIPKDKYPQMVKSAAWCWYLQTPKV